MARSSLFFVIPAHGRTELTRLCLKQLRRTCDALDGIDASAVIVADDENLDTAIEFGFIGYERDNVALGMKFNDGYQVAAYEGADFVIPLGSDDWIDPQLILAAPLPREDRIRCARHVAMVAEDGRSFMRLHISYQGGIGIRIIPTALLREFDYRPAAEDRKRGVDTSTLKRLRSLHGESFELVYKDIHDFQIVDFKSPRSNLNTYDMCAIHGQQPEPDPWTHLAMRYPQESVDEMRTFYESQDGAPATSHHDGVLGAQLRRRMADAA